MSQTDATHEPVAGPRDCPIADALQIVGERWTLLAVREINHGVHRFEQIVGNTGASRDILATRLRKLENAGVITRRQYSEHPPRFEYHLTQAGEELRPVLVTLAGWGRRWAQEPSAGVSLHACGQPLQIDPVCRHCGEGVTSESFRAGSSA
ncbi:MAG: putative HTH-type transcriptional regulator [Actinoallomurus sp.]|jgi:DNA-binding HxlR family transcriptional regulator|nr:putative HTH-type transcriptional regulator [Actinoallomurus sp.]